MIKVTEKGKIKIIDHPKFNDSHWKQISSFKDYFVHPSGFIKSIKQNYNKTFRTLTTVEKILSMFTIKGYVSVNFTYSVDKKEIRKSARLHRIIAETLIPNPEKKPCVNHKDGNKLNNSIENLEWCTYSENEKHSYSALGKISNGIKRRKIKLNQIDNIKKLYSNGESQKKIAKKYNVSSSTINFILNGKTYVKYV